MTDAADIERAAIREVDGGALQGDSLWKSHQGHWITAEPIVSLPDACIKGFIDSPPPARRWLLKDLLPLGVVGLIAAGGGTGKSMLILQLGIAVATGTRFLNLSVGEPGGVLILAAEDEREEIHRRLFRIVHSMREAGAISGYEESLLCDRLFIASRVGDDNRLTLAGGISEVEPTDIGNRIAATARQMPSCSLIVLDPVSRFRGGEENSNDHATRFVEEVEALRAETGATVLLPHHVSKDGLRAGAERLAAENLRGASALLDGVRWAAAMATLSRDAASEYGVDTASAGRHVRLDVVKNNYAAPWPGMWLERAEGGVLEPCQLIRKPGGAAARKAQDAYDSVLPKLVQTVSDAQSRGAPLTRNRLRDMAGKSGQFGVGDQTLRGIVARAVSEGRILERDTGNSRRGVELLVS